MNKRKKRVKRNRFMVSLVLIMAIVFIYSLNNKTSDSTNVLPEAEGSGLEVVNESGIINVLILGVDTNNVKENELSRTDTIMLASLNTKEGKASIISIPRDTRVNIEGRKNKDKINHAHVYGGVDLTKRTIEDLLNISIDNYVKLDYKALEMIINEIGGVEIEVPIDMKYSDPYADPPLKIDLKKGTQVLSGNEAMQFVRFRKGYANQDIGRIGAQQSFIKAVLDEILKPKNIVKIPKIIDIALNNSETDLSKTQIVKNALKGISINTSEINMLTVPGQSKLINDIWYYEPSTDEITDMVNLRFDKRIVE